MKPFSSGVSCAVLAIAAVAGNPTGALAQADVVAFNITATDRAQALNAFAAQANVQLVFPYAAAEGQSVAPLQGRFTRREALDRLLSGSRLEVGSATDRVITLRVVASDGPVTEVEEVVVVGYSPAYDRRRTSFGNKTDDSIFEIPQSVSVLTERLLDEQSPQGLEDVLRNVSGVQSLGQFGGRQDHILFRGFEFGVNRNGLLRNGVQSVSRVQADLGNIERVEVLKGPSTLLYGRAEVGGFVNLVTHQPETTFGGEVFGRLGSWEDRSAGLRITGPTPVENLNFSLYASGATRESFKDDIFVDRSVINPSLNWQATPSLDLSLEFEKVQDTRRMDRGHIAYFPQGTTNTPERGASVVQLPRRRFLGDPVFDKNDYDTDTAWATARYDGDGIQVISVASYGRGRELRRNTEPSSFNSPAALAAGVISRSIVDGETIQDLVLSDTYATIDYTVFGLPMQTLIGGGYRFETEEENRVSRFQRSLNVFTLALSPLPANQTLYGLNRQTSAQRSETGVWSAYVSHSADVTDRITLFAGLRYESINQEIRNRELRNAAGAVVEAPRATDYDFDAVAPRVGAVFQATDTLSFYANYAESFSQQNDAFLAGTAVDLERGAQTEFGLKSALFDNRVVATAAVYEIKKTDMTLPGPVANTFIAVGEARSRGFEFDVTGELIDGLTFVAQYAYTDAETVRGGAVPGQGTGTGAGNTVSGRPLPGAPRNSGSFWVNYSPIASGLWSGLEIGGGVTYVGERAGTATAQFYLPDYTRIDTAIGYRFGDTAVRLVVNNITDEEYYLGARGNANIEYGAPRNIVLSLRHNF
ncbi:TonB-dependent receptor [Brevundimonas albigilva]|uniref:TonB-dependent siderophore receptor n=1 Tax=Brevundimonas albigilva TaxID=1312364 RepID=UPI00201B67DD|nr:TonB-dependent receptor [Brevundimonas albigilva]UQV18952.1 TonB-dependent receptor [Brevundimonas albigilva]